ncbi:MAG: hypothetical protein DLM57_08055 [Pseudonocardiales bacterium]|nr:MAG: hypothetical protein DLM57_08055 [Pseudonocardiales bacterium]
MKLQVDRRPFGQRIAGAAVLTMFVAIMLTLAVDLLRAILPWLVVGGVVVTAAVGLVWWRRRAGTRW